MYTETKDTMKKLSACLIENTIEIEIINFKNK